MHGQKGLGTADLLECTFKLLNNHHFKVVVLNSGPEDTGLTVLQVFSLFFCKVPAYTGRTGDVTWPRDWGQMKSNQD